MRPTSAAVGGLARFLLVATALCLLMAGGCRRSAEERRDPLNQDQSPQAASRRAERLVGTWRGAEQDPNTPFQFAGVTFAPDGTYTAHMIYDDQMRGDSGKWRVVKSELVLAAGRRYELEFRGNDVVVFREPDTLIMVTLRRLK